MKITSLLSNGSPPPKAKKSPISPSQTHWRPPEWEIYLDWCHHLVSIISITEDGVISGLHETQKSFSNWKISAARKRGSWARNRNLCGYYFGICNDVLDRLFFLGVKMSKYEGNLTVMWRNMFLTWHPKMMVSVVSADWWWSPYITGFGLKTY